LQEHDSKISNFDYELIVRELNLIIRESTLIMIEPNLETLKLRLQKRKFEPEWLDRKLKKQELLSKVYDLRLYGPMTFGKTPKDGPSWFQLEPKWLASEPKWLELNPKWRKLEPKWLELESRWLQSELKKLQSDRKWLALNINEIESGYRWLELEMKKLKGVNSISLESERLKNRIIEIDCEQNQMTDELNQHNESEQLNDIKIETDIPRNQESIESKNPVEPKKTISKPVEQKDFVQTTYENSKFTNIKNRLEGNFDNLKIKDLKKIAEETCILKQLSQESKDSMLLVIGDRIKQTVKEADKVDDKNSNAKPANTKPFEIFSEKSEKSAAKIKVEALINFAKTNRILIGEDIFKVKDTTNNVYQLIVDGQLEGNTCGPRACFNCLKFIEYFDKSYNKGAKEISENFRSNKNALNFLRDSAKTLNIKYPPVDLEIEQLQDITIDKSLNIIEGYKELSVETFVQDINLEQRPVGYCWGFVFKSGTVEKTMTLTESLGDIDHWICLFVVKTGAKEYSWFIADSMNGRRFNTSRIKAYIFKFLGETYDVYEKEIVQKQKTVDKKQELETIKKLSDMVSESNTPEVIASVKKQYKKIGKTKTTPEITLSEDDAFNRFFSEKIIDISAMKYADQKMRNDLIELIIKAGRGVNGKMFLKKLNEDIVEFNKLVITKNPDIVETQKIIDRLTINGYPGAENIKTVIIENINNAFSDKIKKT